MVNEDDILTIERYLDGDLGPEEEAIFLEKADRDPELRKALLRARGQQQWLKTQDKRQLLRQEVEQIHQTYAQEALAGPDGDQGGALPQSGRAVWYEDNRRLAFAAALFLLAGALLWWLWPREIDIRHRPIAKNMAVQTEEVISRAQDAFNGGQYALALPLIEEALELQPEDAEWLRALGITQMELADYRTALATFERLLALGPTYANAANFYLGVIYFRMGEGEQARSYLDQVENGDYYYPLAQEFLVKI